MLKIFTTTSSGLRSVERHRGHASSIQKIMAGIKRKDAPSDQSSGGEPSKKHKIEASRSRISEGLVKIQETETDSDPIVESDTTENSGDDDGVSWPSDDGEDAPEFSPPEEKSHSGKPAQNTEGGEEKKARFKNNGEFPLI